jgi:predicted ATPase/transcriptional regulator with XRE-family HTH domain
MMEEKEPLVIFCEWLKHRRKALDLTQDEVAKRAGCSVGALRKIESGERRPSKQLAGLLARALEIPEEERQTFVRVARGELSQKRLGQPFIEPLPAALDISIPQLDQQSLPPDKRTNLPLHRIPLQATPLIGRGGELAAIERIFNDPQCRLLTLTGVGGIGKTRLAIEFATRSASEFPGGIFYIPLTQINSPAEIVPAIADILDFVFSGPTDPKEQLINYLANNIKQKTLFVLDNLETVLRLDSPQNLNASLVGLVGELLERLPDIKILGTSRERLNLHGEWTYELHGLSVPPTDYQGSLENYSSVTLFTKRAQQIKADFQAPVEDQPALIKICQLIEGVPLAIELAAAWVGMLSCQEIAQEIQSNMDFLTTSMRDMPERHRSIKATFDHSWNLLNKEECRALSQLSVFHGGFDRDAAFQIAGASLPLLASLIAKSLVRRTESGRYDLHEVIRQYALSHLDDHPNKFSTYERHCVYYLTLLSHQERSLKSAPQQDAIRLLTDEIDNIRAAWAWAIGQNNFALLEKAGRALGWYFEIAGLYREGIEQLELLVRALKASPQADQWPRVLGLAFIHQALLTFRKGEFDRAQELYEESITILRPIGDQKLLADALIFLGIIQHLQGDFELARSSMLEGLDCARAGNDRWFEAYAIYNLGYLDSLKGKYAEGYEQMMAGLDMWRALGDPHYIALGLNFMVPTLNKLGLYEKARTFMQESIALCGQAKNRWGMGTAYRYLGLAYIAEGNYVEAQANIQKSLEIFGNFTIGWDIARSISYLGDIAWMSGDFSEAQNRYRDALQLSMEIRAFPIALDVLTGLASLKTRTGHVEDALTLCYYIVDHPSSEEETKRRAKELSARLEPELISSQINAARAMAVEKSLGEIGKLALEE